MAAYRRVYDSRHLQADCQEPGSAPEPYARQSSMGYLLPFKYYSINDAGLPKIYRYNQSKYELYDTAANFDYDF